MNIADLVTGLSLDTLVSKNKDEISLTQVDKFEVPTCPERPKISQVKLGLLTKARIVKMSFPYLKGEKENSVMLLLGYYSQGGAVFPLRTSPVKCISGSYVKTENSIYKVEFTNDPVDFELLVSICTMIHASGLGEHYGIPLFFN